MPITAKDINELRQRTGLGMNECKAVLTEANGDINAAIDALRKKGVKSSIAARAATEGKLYIAKAADGKSAAIVEVLCNTDFTAKSDAVGRLLEQALHKQLANPKSNVAEDPEIKHVVTSIAQQTGENVQIGRAVALQNPEGYVGAYVYAITNKIAVLMSFNKKPEAELINGEGFRVRLPVNGDKVSRNNH